MFATGQILVSPAFSEPMRVVTIRAEGTGVWTLGLVGKNTERFILATLSESELAALKVVNSVPSFDGDGTVLRLRRRAPFYLRRTKEAMVHFAERQPDGNWAAKPIFTKRVPHAASFNIDGDDFDLYRDVTQFVKGHCPAAADLGEDARARAVGFLMALCQRWLASSTYTLRHSLENRVKRLRFRSLARGGRRAASPGLFLNVEAGK